MRYSSEEMKIVNHCFKQSVKRYYGNLFNKQKKELLLIGYIALLEYKQTFNLESVDVSNTSLTNYICKAFNKEIKKIVKTRENKTVSISANVFGDDNQELESLLPDSPCYFDSYDYEFLNRCIQETLKEYVPNDQILNNYFFKNEDNLKVFCKNNNISLTKLKELVRDFRKNFSDLLIFCGYENVLTFLKETDEFERTLNHKNEDARNKAKKQGLTLFNVNDFKIYKLMRENANFQEYANCLNVPIEKIDNIIQHKRNAGKLLLYQVQALRKKFFNNYTLAELVEVEECYI